MRCSQRGVQRADAAGAEPGWQQRAVPRPRRDLRVPRVDQASACPLGRMRVAEHKRNAVIACPPTVPQLSRGSTNPGWNFPLETEVPPTCPRVRCLFARIAICGEKLGARGSLPPTGAKQHPQCLLQKRDQTRPVIWSAASPRGDHPAPACPGCWGDEYSQHAPSGSRVGVSQLRVSQALMQKRVPPRPLLCAAEESARCRGRGRNHLPAKLGDGRRGCFSILSEARTAWLRTVVIPVPTLR